MGAALLAAAQIQKSNATDTTDSLWVSVENLGLFGHGETGFRITVHNVDKFSRVEVLSKNSLNDPEWTVIDTFNQDPDDNVSAFSTVVVAYPLVHPEHYWAARAIPVQ